MADPTTAQKVAALTDIWAFSDLIDFKGGRKNFGNIHKKLAGFVTAPQSALPCLLKKRYNNRRLVLVPRGHLKSSVCSVLYVLWRIYRNPNIRILVGTNLKALSQAFIRELRVYLEDEELGRKVWNARPHVPGRLIPIMDVAGRKRRQQRSEEETDAQDKKVLWTIDAVQVLRSEPLKEPTVLATSLGTRVVGQHFDLLILDDIVDFENSSTVDKIERLIDWAGDMESVIDPQRLKKCGSWFASGVNNELWEHLGDEVVVLGTRYVANDYYDYLMCNMKSFDYRVFSRNIYRNGQNYVPATNVEEEYATFRRNYRNGDPDGGYIWAEKFDDTVCKRIKSRLKPARWYSQYLNTIVVDGEAILDVNKIKHFGAGRCEVKDGLVYIKLKDDDIRVVRPIVTVDPAVSQSATADSTAIMVGGMDEDLNLYILDLRYGRFTPDRTIDAIFSVVEKWSSTKVVIEVVGFQAALVFMLREQMKPRGLFPYIVEHRPQGTGEKKQRLEAGLQPLFENEKIYLVDWLSSHQGLNDELMFFPQTSAHDDALDALDMIRIYSQRLVKPTGRRTASQRLAVNTKYGGMR